MIVLASDRPRAVHSVEVAPHIRHLDIDGYRIILDLREGAYLTMDPIGAAFWAALTRERGAGEVVARISGRFDAPESVLRRDLKQFEERCIAEGFLVSGATAPAPARHPPRRRRTSRAGRSAFYCLVATAHALNRGRLYEAYAHPRALGTRRPRWSLTQALARFRLAENLFISARAPKDCLPRSLALFRYLVAHGFAAEHLIGVRRAPFLAHAWVEIEGRPLLEANTAAFRPLARLASA